jgi:uncharacterized protein YeaO (DUF488 family)
MSALSPSSSLFFKYRELIKNGQWGPETFRSIYVPRFLEEMHSEQAVYWLNRLWKADRIGRSVLLACYCSDEAMCHRSIVAGLLQGAGADVRAQDDYSYYYDMWKGENNDKTS